MAVLTLNEAADLLRVGVKNGRKIGAEKCNSCQKSRQGMAVFRFKTYGLDGGW